MEFEQVYCVTDRLSRVSRGEVVAVEKSIGLIFPKGYDAFVTQFGEGVYSGFVRIFPPEKIKVEYLGFQERWAKYYFWEVGAPILRKAQVVKSVILGDTLQGDELVFNPAIPDALYVLPRNSELIYKVGSDLKSALNWLCGSNELTAPINSKYFEPWLHRTRATYVSQKENDFFHLAGQLENSIEHDKTCLELDGDQYFQMFVPSIKGTICFSGECIPIEIWMEFDEDIDLLVLESIENSLNALHFQKLH